MAIPVAIPNAALSIDDVTNAAAEAVVAALGQVMGHGSTGASVTTPALAVPDPPINPTGTKTVDISPAPTQLFFRQLALAIVKGLGLNFVTLQPFSSVPDGTTDIVLPHAPFVESVVVHRGSSTNSLSVDTNRSVVGSTVTISFPKAAGESIYISYRY